MTIFVKSLRRIFQKREPRRSTSRFPLAAEVLEDRLLLAKFEWIGPNNAVWADPAAWKDVATGMSGAVPGAGDIAQLSEGSDAPRVTANQNVGSVVAFGQGSHSIQAENGSTLQGVSIRVGQSNQDGELELKQIGSLPSEFIFETVFVGASDEEDADLRFAKLTMTDTNATFDEVRVGSHWYKSEFIVRSESFANIGEMWVGLEAERDPLVTWHATVYVVQDSYVSMSGNLHIGFEDTVGRVFVAYDSELISSGDIYVGRLSQGKLYVYENGHVEADKLIVGETDKSDDSLLQLGEEGAGPGIVEATNVDIGLAAAPTTVLIKSGSELYANSTFRAGVGNGDGAENVVTMDIDGTIFSGAAELGLGGKVNLDIGGLIEGNTNVTIDKMRLRTKGDGKVLKAGQEISLTMNTEVHLGLEPGMFAHNEFDGNLNASAGMVYFVDVDADWNDSDQIYVTGTATLGGILNVSLYGTPPMSGSAFRIVVAAGGLSGTFDLAGSSLPSLPPGFYWAVDYGQNYVDLVIYEPLLWVTGVQVDESAGTAIFYVTLDNGYGNFLTENVLVDYQTLDGTATAGEDYVATSGTLTFSPTQTYQTIEVTILDDWDPEDIEDFLVRLSNGRLQSGGTINIYIAEDIGVIWDDDF